MMSIAHRISHGTNVVVVNNQSANSKIFLLLLDWMRTTTTFVPWDILWTMLISLARSVGRGSGAAQKVRCGMGMETIG